MPSPTARATPPKPHANPTHCRARTGSPSNSANSAVTIGMMPVTSAISPRLTPRAAAKYTHPNCSASEVAPTTVLCSSSRPRGQAARAKSASSAKISPAPPKRSTRSVKGGQWPRAILAVG